MILCKFYLFFLFLFLVDDFDKGEGTREKMFKKFHLGVFFLFIMWFNFKYIQV